MSSAGTFVSKIGSRASEGSYPADRQFPISATTRVSGAAPSIEYFRIRREQRAAPWGGARLTGPDVRLPPRRMRSDRPWRNRVRSGVSVVNRVQPARDPAIAGMPHDDLLFAEPVKTAGGREQLQLDFIVGVRSPRDRRVQVVVAPAQFSCAFLHLPSVECVLRVNFYESLGFATSRRSGVRPVPRR